MSKAQIENFIIDLKVTPEGDVKILELGELLRSGFTGFKRMSKLSMTDDFVYPFLRSFDVPVYQSGSLLHPVEGDPSIRMGIIPIKSNETHFDPTLIRSHNAILLRCDMPNMLQHAFLNSACGNRILMPNTNKLACAAYNNKALFSLLATGTMGHILPKQHVYAVVNRRVDVRRILEDFKGHEHLVLKQPENARAQGVDIRSYSSIEARAHNGYLNQDRLKTKFSKKHDTMLVVQETIKGQCITAESKRGKEAEHDPVIRVVATAYRDGGETNIEFHGAYYKIPPKPASDKLRKKSLISDVKNGPTSPYLDEELQGSIYEQLASGLKPFFSQIFSADGISIAREWLNSDDPAKQNAATELVSNENYFDYRTQIDDSTLNLTFPQDIIPRLYALRKQSRKIRNILWAGVKCPPLVPPGLYAGLRNLARKDGFLDRLDILADLRSYKRFASIAIPVAVFFTLLTLAAETEEDARQQLTDTFNFLNTQSEPSIPFSVSSISSNLALYTKNDAEKYKRVLTEHLPNLVDQFDAQSCFNDIVAESHMSSYIANTIATTYPNERFISVNIGERFSLIGTSCPDIQWPDGINALLQTPAP